MIVVVGLKGWCWSAVSQRVDLESRRHAQSNALKIQVIDGAESVVAAKGLGSQQLE